jgi:hypothetical protein
VFYFTGSLFVAMFCPESKGALPDYKSDVLLPELSKFLIIYFEKSSNLNGVS